MIRRLDESKWPEMELQDEVFAVNKVVPQASQSTPFRRRLLCASGFRALRRQRFFSAATSARFDEQVEHRLVMRSVHTLSGGSVASQRLSASRRERMNG